MRWSATTPATLRFAAFHKLVLPHNSVPVRDVDDGATLGLM
jgi:hypothetical protein